MSGVDWSGPPCELFQSAPYAASFHGEIVSAAATLQSLLALNNIQAAGLMEANKPKFVGRLAFGVGRLVHRCDPNIRESEMLGRFVLNVQIIMMM